MSQVDTWQGDVFNACLHQAFQTQALRTPQMVAVEYGTNSLTYEELEHRANRLAQQLVSCGVQPDSFVAICLHRSIDLAVSLLATLKAGGACLPLDPAYPADRLRYIIKDAKPQVVVTTSTLLADKSDFAKAFYDSHTICLDRATADSEKQEPNITSVVTPDNLAYVLYTSGSTGKPKGVMMEHKALTNLVRWHLNKWKPTQHSVVLQFASLNFDISFHEIFSTWCGGGTLVIAPEEVRHDPPALLELLDRKRVQKIYLPFVMLQQLAVEIGTKGFPPALVDVITAGEQLRITPEIAAMFKASRARLHNHYGSTEVQDVTSYTLPANTDEWPALPPIGSPIDNCNIYILDEKKQPASAGEIGELYVGGVQLARGYLGQPELTQAHFLVHSEAKSRIYRTGDLARCRPDGVIEYLGRADRQVKIRGIRIELGEIEACLAEHSQVREVVVLAQGDGSKKRLIAYVVAQAGARLAGTLHAHVAAALPEHMVPAAFVRLDALPLTPNGKLDRRALPAPDDEAFAHQAYEAPQGELEAMLAAIWAELLGVERVGRHDSFFALGGHSLLAVQLIERLRRRGLSVSVRALFDTPTLSALAQTLGQHRDVVVPANTITPDTSAITPSMLPLIELTQADIDKIVGQVPGGVANIQDIYALSPLQDGLLFHHLLASTGDPYLLMVQLAFDTRERLDQYLHALQQVIDRHDILRTAFAWEGMSMPAQVVWRHARLPVTELTLDAADGPIAEQLARRFDPRHTRLDLTQAPLLHCAIAQDSKGRWLLTQRLHHLIGDHSTLEVMHVEVGAFIEGRGDTLPPAQPFRHLVAQARLGVSQAEHERFFTEQLASIEEPTLPFGLAQVQHDGSDVSESHRMLPPALNDRLRAHAKRLGVSLASLCHLAWAQVLARASGQQRVVFGTVLFGRMQAGEGADRAMGLFINTLPLRVDLDGSMQACVRSTHARLAALLEHEHASLALAQRCSGVPAGTPLFSALLNYRHNAIDSNERSGLPGVELLSVQERTNYPLTLSVEDFGQALGLTVQSVSSLEPERVCAYMQQALHSLADALEVAPDTPMQQLQVLPEAERELLLNTWNATQQAYPKHRCVHQLFEAQVERTPEALALIYEDQTFSYARLNAQANRLAHQLIELGVKPDARVAICVQRSPALVVGLLAILKAGGAYVPLDPAYPSERLVHILTDAAPAIVLADAAGRAALGDAGLASCTVLDPATVPALPDTNPSVAGLTARHLAYVIYTSGSTGTPKGVMVEHAQVVRLFEATQPWYGFNEHDTWCLFHSFAFDFSVWELWGALRYGGKLVIVHHSIARSADAFYQLICEQGVTVLNQTPSAFKALMASQAYSALSDQLRYVILGGEALEPAILQAWYATHDERHPQLVNMYGITEATVHVTYRPLRQQDSEQAGSPVGTRIPDLTIYLLDAHGQPVPLGAVGELYIGGAGVARGYLNRPELTAERFVPDPFSEDADARLYKTGDVARYLPDGNLEFVGRNDEQVKIRGFRIEPGEIEACLTAHPQVRDAVVLAIGEGSAKRLVAYVQAEANEHLASTLRAQVAATLPEYMVPSAFVRLDAWPLTPNGKLDRRALPAPDDEALAHQAYEAPQGELETTLAAIWAELLGVERVGRHDSFFALGGHSLLAVRLMNRVRMLGADVPLATLFTTPTLTAFAAALEAHLQQGTDALSEITPVSREDSLPLSFAQQRLWFLAQLDGVSESYHIPLVLHVRGSLDRAAWHQALDALLARHEALRSTFVSVEGQPQVQLLPADTGVPLRWHDLRGVPDADAQLSRLSHEAARAPFDLARGPLIHACGIQVADDEHVVLLTQHHIVSDGWSIGVLTRELSALYAANVGAQVDPLPPLAVQYPDYAAWQRQWLTGERLQTQSDYWRTTLADAPALLELPTDRPRPAQQSFAGAQVSVRIDVSTTQALKRLSAEHGTTLFMTVLAAWSAVLARLSGQDDLVIGTPSANRGHRAIEPLIGFFVNTLALRVDLSGEPNTSELLKRVRCTTLDAQAHQDLPFEQVVEVVQPPRRLNHTPLFQVLFAWQSNETGQWRLPGLDVTPDELDYDIARFDLEMHLYEAGEEIIGALHYASALFDSATVERHVGYLTTMLQAMAACPQQPVATLQMLGAEERQLLLQTWNATAAPYPAHQCLHQLFEAQVQRSPDATALVYEEQTLSYAQLNARANRLAHRLIELGVKPDARVAICVERSPAMVVGLLAIMKAGGAYVPLDPAYPCERLAHILADTGSAIALADTAGQSALGDTVLASFTVLDPNVLPERATTNPQVPELTARHLAYVIYTSGSTGMPKGVMVEHAQIAHLFDVTQLDDGQKKNQASMNHPVWMRQAYGLTPDDRVLQKAPLTFDVSVWECFCTLLNGATLVVAAPGVHRDPSALMELMIRQRITTVHFVPSMLSMFLATDGVQRCTAVKRVLCTGEALTSTHVRLCQRLLPHAQLHNLYGPTEATIGVAAWTCPAEYTQDTIPIGRPIAHNRLYLLDRHGQPVPLRATGELYISGASVVRGYLNEPDLTAERFLLDPFSDREGARMYKTGDLARYRSDGNLEFLGRNDHQVKIRGLRIELGEIKTCLVRHPQVQEAVVLALGEGIDKRLVAYVVAEPDDALASELRAHVAARLPEYMVPSAFVRLDVLPLTPNGKLDRRALPEPDADALAQHAYEAPQGELETTLAAIWAELLGVERVGRHDSFFVLGGHSLLAVRLMNRVSALGADVPLAALFASPTLAAFAVGVKAQLNQQTSTLPEITPVSRGGNLPLSFAQQRLWFLAQLEGVSKSYHIPLALHVCGPFDRAAWQQALDALLARHEALRSTFVSVEGQPQVQLLPADRGVPLRWHDLRGVPDADAQLSRLSADEARAPFDLVQGPLIRARGIQLADNEYRLVLTMHHIVSDGWSFGVLVRELNALYAANVGAQADPLPALAIQYPDYAAWQRQWLAGERFQTQSDYWRATLADAPVLLELPTDRPRPAQQSFAGAQVPVRIDAAKTRALKRLSAEHGATLFMTVLAAWSAVLARLSDQDDLVIGTPSANRNHRQIEPLIGFFVNTLALRVDLSGEPDTAQLVARARRTTLDAQAHQDLPFEQVVEIVQPPRRLNHTPLFQVMLAWQNNEPGEWRLPGLTAMPAELEYDAAKFDLELNLSEAGEEIIGSLGYATALFDRSTIEQHVGYLQTMLRSMVACPQQPVATLELLSTAERQLLLNTWNATQQAYPSHWCVHQLFEAQVERTPEATALVFEDQTFSYAQLNAQANRLAHQLIELRVKPDVRVAICVERSPAMVVGLLAILKAGGAYVPLDPAYPSERLAHILADAAPMIVLADAAGRAALGDAALAECTVLDPATLPALPDTNPSVAALTARHLAYVIYTSGSTGTPKGVMVEHRSVVNLVQAQISCFDICPFSRILQFASFGFDVNTSETFIALNSGASLYLPPDTARHDRTELWRYLEKHAITCADLPPALLQAGEDLSHLSSPLTLILGGEAPRATLIRNLVRQGAVVFNAYGLTETTISSTVWRSSQDFNGEVVPIGRPLDNTRIYLLDARSQPVPLGAVGELYIGGVGVARGYLNRTELTAERFVTDPFSSVENARMYKTGDLARYLPDGSLEFLGRNDEQVKIRGFRIEPGEIEACLTAHPQVRDAVVLATGEGSAKRLVAYVQAEADEQLASTLRAQVAASLPEYMVPSAFVRLDAFPLTPNGKLDRRALPAPDADALAHQAYEAPQGELETTLAEIWAELLGVERVGRHDSFFALGGHSLLAMRLMSRVRDVLGVELAIRTLFEAPTLAGLARHLVQHDGMQENSFSVLLPLKPTGSRPALFCIHPGFGLSWSYMGLSSYFHPDQPLYGLQARGLNGTSPLASTLDEMVSDYLEQMRRVQPQGPYCLLGWSFGCIVAHSLAVRLEHQGEKVALLALLDSTPFAGKAFEEEENQLDQAMIRDVFAYHYGNELASAMDKHLLENTEEIAKNNVRIVRDYSPSQYGGDALLFRATVAEAEGGMLVSPDVWNPYVRGNIEVCNVHCSHGAMLKPEPMAIIGPILARKLNELENQQTQGQTNAVR
ncbi:non-ribosomal peptide synthetase [Mycetohabitans endofungorum]|uniref:Amino acid adenylation domain-containing protein n=1 Tax=Mycetohabitans endofungorum TaxID=417203 RepID=A0A2P5K6N9_9BURK|nr:amino acid adenylation domain-containing protein [Mycetohabitans endofungorum]